MRQRASAVPIRRAQAGLAALVVAVALASTAGCKQAPPAAPQNGPANTPGNASAPTTPTPAKAKSLRLAGIVFQQDQFFQLVLTGMRAAAKEAGAELMEASSANRPDKEIELVNTYAARKVDAIVISPVSKSGSVAALELAHKQGAKVVCYNTPVAADFPAAYVECSPADLGQQTGKAARAYIEAKLGGKAKIAIVAFKSQVAEQSDARSGGFKAELKSLPGVRIVAEQDAWLPEMAVKKVGDILTAHPDVNVVYAANEGGTTGAVLAVKNAGKAGKVAVFGTDVSEQLLAMLQSNDDVLQAITAQRPVDLGRQAVQAAIKAVNGEPVEKKTSLSGVLLTRTDLNAVRAYEKEFRGWIGRP